MNTDRNQKKAFSIEEVFKLPIKDKKKNAISSAGRERNNPNMKMKKKARSTSVTPVG